MCYGRGWDAGCALILRLSIRRLRGQGHDLTNPGTVGGGCEANRTAVRLTDTRDDADLTGGAHCRDGVGREWWGFPRFVIARSLGTAWRAVAAGRWRVDFMEAKGFMAGLASDRWV